MNTQDLIERLEASPPMHVWNLSQSDAAGILTGLQLLADMEALGKAGHRWIVFPPIGKGDTWEIVWLEGHYKGGTLPIAMRAVMESINQNQETEKEV